MTTRTETNVQESPVRGALVRHLRETFQHEDSHRKPGFTRQKFSALADVSPSTLQRVEESDPGVTVPVMARIAKHLGVPLETIYDYSLSEAPKPAANVIDPARWEQIEAFMRDMRREATEVRRRLDGIERRLP